MQTRLKKGDRIRLVSMPQDPDPIPLVRSGPLLKSMNTATGHRSMSTGTTAVPSC